ncbi:MAG: AI-2E family transporter [Candidatus Pacearchaeota archaeon]
MVDEKTIKQIFATSFILPIIVFAYIIIKPIFFSIIFGLILAYSFNYPNKIILKKIKQPTISAAITCSFVVLILILMTWFLLPILILQTFDSYLKIQSWDGVSFFKSAFPFFFSNQQISSNFESMYNVFISSMANITLEKLTGIISDLPSLILKIFVILIVFFYGLRDGDKIIDLVRDSLPFNKSTTNRFITKSREVTFSVIFGRIIVGIISGTLTGLGLYIVGIKNIILLTFLAILASIIPLIGPWIIWIPAVVSLFISGKVYAGVFLLTYGIIIVTLLENILHPLFISRTSKIATSLTLIGIIGGLLVFGIFGIILGPLVMAYLSVLFELYKETKPES